MILLLLTPAGAFAADFDMTCEKPLALAKNTSCKNNTTDPNCVSLNKNLKEMGGDQTVAYCMQADLARRGFNYELAKSVVYSAASLSCFAAAAGLYFTTAVCAGINIGAAAGGSLIDLGGDIDIKSKSKSYHEQCDQIGEAKINQWNNIALTSSSVAPLIATKSFKVLKTSKVGGCIICGTTMGILAGISIDGTLKLDKSINSNVIYAEGVMKAASESVGELGGSGSNSIKKNDTSVVQSSSNTPIQNNDSEDCSSPDVKGDHYMKCISKQVPEIAAITNNPAVMKEFSKALKGKNLGDFIKGYDGKGDVKDYVAKGMNTGISPELFKGISNANEPFAKKIGLSIQPQSGSSGFAKVGGASAGGRGDLDYGSKAAAGVASNLNDASLGAEKEVTALDPADALFRQLDLLSPDQIESNPKISLFVRAAYRYRKNINNVEKLNSAIEERVPATNKR